MASCGGGKSPADTLVVAIESSPTAFDPRLAVDAYSIKIDQLIYNGLIKLGPNFEYVPDLAAKFEQVGTKAYRFYLRPGVYFHNGEPLKASDVIYTFQSVIDGTVASPYRTTFGYIKEMKVEPDGAITIILKEPHAPFLTVMTKGIIPKVLAEELGKDFGHNPVGTGPYKLVEFKSDAHVLLKANENYFGEKPKLPFLKFEILKDDNVRVLQLMKGTIDLVQNAVPPVLLKMLDKRKDIDVDSAPSIVFAYIGMNFEDEILSNPDVRRALAHGINREEIIKYKWEGYGRIANTLLVPGHWAFNANVRTYEYDPEMAKKFLDQAGYPDPDGDGPEMRFYLSYKTSTQKQRIDIANLIAKQLEKVGIGITVTPYEWGTFFRDVKTGNFQLYSLAWVGITEPDIYYSIFNSSQMPPVGANRNRYLNKEIDRLTQMGRTTLNQNERAKIYNRIQDIVAEELPYIPLWYEDNIVVRRDNVKGFKIMPNAGFQGFINVVKKK
jgi:peptide/nickel transport system substrate-binding protein